MITNEYNNALNILLPKYGVEVQVLERKMLENGVVISASLVRKALQAMDWNTVSNLVPKSTLDYIIKHIETCQ